MRQKYKNSFRMMYSNLCLIFREPVRLSTMTGHFSGHFEECSVRHTIPLKNFCVPLRDTPFCLT